MEAELKKIRGDGLEDQKTFFDDIAKKSEQKIGKVKDNFKDLHTVIQDNIEKSKSKIDDLNGKIKDSADKINELKASLIENTNDRQKDLTDRFVQITNELAAIQAQKFDFSSIEEYNKQQEKYAQLQNELAFIARNVDQAQLNKAIDFDRLSEAEKIIARSEEAKAAIEAKIKEEEDAKKALEKQREDEIIAMNKFNTAKIKVERDYTKLFGDELQARTDRYAQFVSDINALNEASKVNINNIVGNTIA